MAMAEADSDGGVSEFGETLYGSEGDDDDCKYHVKFTASCVEKNKDVTFTATLTNKADKSPVKKATPDLEAFLSETHTAPNTKQVVKEATGGVYTVGPVQFDRSGKWTVRFHFRDECSDLPDSPHGHVAFYIDVP